MQPWLASKAIHGVLIVSGGVHRQRNKQLRRAGVALVWNQDKLIDWGPNSPRLIWRHPRLCRSAGLVQLVAASASWRVLNGGWPLDWVPVAPYSVLSVE